MVHPNAPMSNALPVKAFPNDKTVKSLPGQKLSRSEALPFSV